MKGNSGSGRVAAAYGEPWPVAGRQRALWSERPSHSQATARLGQPRLASMWQRGHAGHGCTATQSSHTWRLRAQASQLVTMCMNEF